MIKFLIYFLLAGMYVHWKITNVLTMTEEDINKLTDKKKETIQDMNREIYIHFGNLNILPFAQILALLFGWILIPISIVNSILKLFNIKVD